MRLPAEVPEALRGELVEAALTCPVALSLHPDIEVDLSVTWG